MQRLSPELVALSIDRGAPASLRERTPPGAAARRSLLEALQAVASERLVLHTCERLELYLAAEGGEASELLSPLARWLEVSPAVLASHAEVYRGDAVVRHLFRVVVGLESRLVGEPQVRGQVREAFKEAREAGAIGAYLDALFRAALHTGRVVRRDTTLGRGTSLVDLTLARLREDLAGLRGRAVIVAGTGGLAAELVDALSAAGALAGVASRTVERAEALAQRHRTEALSHSDLPRALGRADALVTCTHGQLPIDVSVLAGRLLAVVDLGMPSNVAPDVAFMPGTRLTRLDDLTGAAAGPDIAKALAIVANEHAHYLRGRSRRAARFVGRAAA